MVYKKFLMRTINNNYIKKSEVIRNNNRFLKNFNEK